LSPEPFVFSSVVKKHKIKTYKTIILLVVLYRYETWPLTLREEHKLKVFQNRVLGKIIGHKEGEIIRGWKKVYDVLFPIYNWNDHINDDEMDRGYSTYGAESKFI
jgi:hypothetical protein